MKTVGIIGGVGPDTTAEVYLSIVNKVRTSGSDQYPPIVIYNLPFPFVIEEEAIVQGVHAEKMIPYLVRGAEALSDAKADFGILPCNTLHAYIVDIRAKSKIPFLSILEETSNVLKAKGINKVGILATETTIRTKIYETVLAEHEIQLVCPERADQDAVNRTIMALLQGEKGDAHVQVLQQVSERLASAGVEAILLACTDLQLIADRVASPVPLLDTTEILVAAALREMGAT